MDPLVPGGALGGAAALSASTARDALLEKLKTGEWTYPETKWGEMNMSGVFDFVFVFLILGAWAYATLVANGKMEDRFGRTQGPMTEKENSAIEKYCLKGNFNGGRFSGLFKYVAFFTMEEVTNWLAVSLVCTLIVLKILCGARNVNAGYVIYALIVGVVARHMRLGIKGEVLRQVPPATMILSLFFTLWAYTDAFGARVEGNSEEHGKNVIYIVAGVLFGIAAIVKTYISTGNMATLEGDPLQEKIQMLYHGEFAFYLTGFSTVIVGGLFAAFVISEAIFVAYAATKYYAVPFYFLYGISLYFLISVPASNMQSTDRAVKLNGRAMVFNLGLVLLGTAILVLAQGQVCSLPGPDGLHSGKSVCGDLAAIGFKDLGSSASELEMHPGALTALGILAVLFHVLLYAGARFSRMGLVRTIGEVCVNAEKNGYSVENTV